MARGSIHQSPAQVKLEELPLPPPVIPVSPFVDENLDPYLSSSRHQPPRRSYTKKLKKDTRIPRPLNCFMVFRREWGKVNRVLDARVACRKCGEMWTRMTFEEKRPYIEMAKAEALIHKETYPDYKYCPRQRAVKPAIRDRRCNKPVEQTVKKKEPPFAPPSGPTTSTSKRSGNEPLLERRTHISHLPPLQTSITHTTPPKPQDRKPPVEMDVDPPSPSERFYRASFLAQRPRYARKNNDHMEALSWRSIKAESEDKGLSMSKAYM